MNKGTFSANKQSFSMNRNYSANRPFYLLIVIFSFISILLVSLFQKIVPLTLSHPVYLCKQMIESLAITLPHFFPSLLVTFIFFIFFIGLVLIGTKIISTYTLIFKVKRAPLNLPISIKKLATDLKLESKIDLVNYKESISFCYGLLNPKICLSNSLVNRLTRSELKAVLLHEKYHIENKDPLKILLTQVVSSMLFFIPVLGDIQKHFSLSKEILADQLSIKQNGIKNLRSALIKVLTDGNNSTCLAYFTNEETLEKRIDLITSKDTQFKSPTFLTNLLISILVVISIFLFIRMPVHAMENANSTHSYHICLSNGECMMSCKQETMSRDSLFSSQPLYAPVNFSTAH